MQLNPSSILSVPIQTYPHDFTFTVNGEDFRTSRIVSDLLSPNICRIHENDPTCDKFIINTKHRGNFSNILNLVSFNQINLPKNEVLFISEVIELLGNESLDILELVNPTELTTSNVFQFIINHERYGKFYLKLFLEEVSFISEHFYELCEKNIEDFKKLNMNTILSILTNPKLQLIAEDQLLKFINKLYQSDPKYSTLYENVYFSNVSSKAIEEFLEIYDYNDMTTSTWINLSDRLNKELNQYKVSKIETTRKRYKKQPPKGTLFALNGNNYFSGILNFFKSKSLGKIEREINITSSSVYYNQENCKPSNVVLFDDDDNVFLSENQPNSSISFDFRDHRIIPSNYTIKSSDPSRHNGDHPKCWIFEASNDNDSWETLDSQDNCTQLNGPNLVQSFPIKKKTSKEFRYIRLRSTGPSWSGENHFGFDSFEIFGSMI